MKEGRRKPLKLCPRCRGVYSWLEERRVGGRRYLYSIHLEGGRKRYCYLGPSEGYVEVERLHGLGLTNVRDADYLSVAESALRRLSTELRRLSAPELSSALARLRGLEEAARSLAVEAESRLRGLEAGR